MKIFMFSLIVIVQFINCSFSEYAKIKNGNINKKIYDFSEQSLEESLIICRDALQIIKRIKHEFDIKVPLIETEHILRSIENGKGEIEILGELNNYLEKVGDEQEVVKCCMMLGYDYYHKGEFQKAINNYKISLDKCSKIKSISLTNLILQNLAVLYYDIGDFKKSTEYCSRTLEIGIKGGDKKIILLALNYLAYNYTAICDYEKAIEYSLKTIDLCKELNEKQVLALILQNIGTIYSDIYNYDKSLVYNLESLRIKKEIGDEILIITSLNSIGMVYCKMNEYNQSLSYLNESLELNRRLKYKQGLATVLDNLGYIHKKLGNKSLSIYYFKRALKITSEINDLWNFANINIHIGEYYIMQNEYLKAGTYLDQGLLYSKKIKATDLVIDCYKSYTELYEKIGDYHKAYQYFKLYCDSKDSTFIKIGHKIGNIHLKYETQIKDRENETLKIKNIAQTFELNKQKSLSWNLFFGVTILLSLLSFIYSRYRIKNRQNIHLSKKVDESLEKQKQQSKIILHQASLITIGEYSAAIAHEINQPLQLMFFDIESIALLLKEKEVDFLKISRMLKIFVDNMNRIKFITDHVKNFSCRQKEYVKENFDLNFMVKNIIWMVQKQYGKIGIKINLIFEKPYNIINGSLFKLEQVFLNLLSNARDSIEEKCAYNPDGEFKFISIKCTGDYKYAILVIEDRGIGIKPDIKDFIFDPFFTTKNFGRGIGLGLSIVKEVIEEMNGKIEVNSTYLQGTIIKLKIPIQNENLEKKIE